MGTKLRSGIDSGMRPIALLVVSIVITSAIVVAMLVGAFTAPAHAAPVKCQGTVHPVDHTIEFIGTKC